MIQINPSAARIVRTLPVVPVPPSTIHLSPTAVGDATVRASVDAKLNAALKEQLKQALNTRDEAALKIVDGLAINYREHLNDSLPSLLEKFVLPALQKDFAPLVALLRRRSPPQNPPSIKSVLMTDVPLASNPLFADDVRRGGKQELLRITRLAPALLDAVDHNPKPLEAFTEDEWKSLSLPPAQRDDLFLSSELSRLTGGQYRLVDAARQSSVKALGDLTQLDQAHWLDLIRRTPGSTPEGMTPETYAGLLVKGVQKAHLSQYFSLRIAQKPESFGPAQLAAYRHLGKSSAEITPRIDQLSQFLKNNSSEDLRYLDLLGTTPNWSGVADQAAVKSQLLAYQRVLNLADTHDTAMALLGNGLDSSSAIADLGYNAFRARTGLDHATAAPVWNRARRKAAQAAHGVQAIADAVSSLQSSFAFRGPSPSLVNDLAALPGWSDLFGSTNYCDCADCNSIFSPAAYFVDLMYFIDKNITQAAFASLPNHALRLNLRRPDLWTLPLTCDNTNTLIPQLTLVNEILENYLKKTLAIADVDQTLLGSRIAIGLPYHTQADRVREYLSDWNTDLAALYQLLGAPGVDQETLRLSDEEWAALIAAPLDLSWIRFATADHTQMDVVDFLAFAGITRDQLNDLKKTTIAGGFNIIRVMLNPADIQSEKEVVTQLTGAILDHAGRLLRLSRKSGYGLLELDEALTSARIGDTQPFTAKSLTGLARLKRLQTALSLTAETAIAIVDHIPTRPLQSGAQSLAEKLGLPMMSATWPVSFHHAHFQTTTPVDATVDAKQPALLAILGIAESDLLALFAHYPARFVFDAAGNCPLDREKIALLYAHVTLARTWQLLPADLSLIIDRLLPTHEFRTLDLLEQLQQAVAMVAAIPIGPSQLVALLDAQISAVTIDQVVAMVTQLQQSGALLFTPSILTSLAFSSEDAATIFDLLGKANLVAASGAKYQLTAAYVPGMDLAPILPNYSARKADIHTALMAFHFTNILPNNLAGVVGLAVDQALIAMAFARQGWAAAPILTALSTQIVNGAAAQPAELAPLMDLTSDLARLAQLFGALGLSADDCWFTAQYPAIFGISDIRHLTISDIANLQRYRQWLLPALTTAQSQNLLWQYHSRVHGTLAPAALFTEVASTPLFAQALADPARAPLLPGTAPVAVPEAQTTSALDAGEIAQLAQGPMSDAGLLSSLLWTQKLPGAALDAFSQLQKLYSFCTLLSVQGPSLAQLLSRNPAGFKKAADFLWSLLNQKYAGDATKLAPRTSNLNERLRDALCDYIVANATTLKFKSRDELYAYFLIDVQMGGCFETSRVVAALSSLQLYVYRCLVDLEQSASDGLVVLSKIDSEEIGQQWEWRQNYRVWEANRRVFVYPENYIEPELRDNKSPLFQDLEDQLLQQNITVDAAEQAYDQYLTGFSTLARLLTVGACFDADNKCYWFVGRTHNDPYQYYLRQYHADIDRWDPWQVMEVGIVAPYATPIVHLGRLYVFWVEMSTMDKSYFVGGNQVFQGVETRATLHYSHRQESGKWAADQKIPFADMIDRVYEDKTPALIKQLTNLELIVLNKGKTEDAAAAYQRTKTYARVMVNNSWSKLQVDVHYYRKYKTTDLEWVKKGKVITSVAEEDADNLLLVDKDDPDAHAEAQSPNPTWSFQYLLTHLDLVTKELTMDTVYDNKYIGNDSETYYYWGAGGGVRAAGLLKGTDALNQPTYTVIVRDYALPVYPSATDNMLISGEIQNGHALTTATQNNVRRDMVPVNYTDDSDDLAPQQETLFLHGTHQHWIRPDGQMASLWKATRINTTLDSYLSQQFFAKGLDGFLTLATQTGAGEDELDVQTLDNKKFAFEKDAVHALPYSGSYGDYYRELFFHTPFSVAAQLNSQGRYEDAKHWYEKIFNPTAPPPPNDTNPRHRVWQFLEFHDELVPTLKAILSDEKAIDLYEHDPFNPHAIARLRPIAYEKTIVMHYVNNLLDWGDSLFTQETMESVNEATMLYVLAESLLGPRPVSAGKCNTADENTLTYAALGPQIAAGSEFVMYLENISHQATFSARLAQVGLATPSTTMTASNVGPSAQYLGSRRVSSLGSLLNAPTVAPVRPARPAPDFVRTRVQAFCVPVNEQLLGLWDRVEDRLFKIRHCLDIDGNRVSIALFAPPIDPMLLVRAKAAGLSIEEIIGQMQEALPPYRFTYLAEKARQYVTTAQSLGNSLLGALEKKDAEELAALRATHEQNLLTLNRSVRKQQIDEAKANLDGVSAQKKNVQNRIDYYKGLIAAGLISWEASEQSLKQASAMLRTDEAMIRLEAGLAYLVPQLGSPFALKYGGKEIGDSLTEIASWTGVLAGATDAMSGAAGLEATFQRRSQDWQQQLKLAAQEMSQIEKQELAATIRLSIAEKELSIQEQQIEQSKAVHDFLSSKFSNTRLYTFLSSQMMRLYREVYQAATRMARQAERAYQFERDATNFFIQPDNWQSEHSGLLAGDKLLLQVQQLEQAYFESNLRELEVSQSFSLLQINPAALEALQETGTCSFSLPEILFDMQYPGQYRRLLKSLKLTIPCVVGPYTNIGATLRLDSSKIRRAPDADPAQLVDMPLTMTRTIATSHAQNDAGVFELNFRDERYLPFEGAGAVSDWTLKLPSQLRMFDYSTLSDVIINLSYVAKYDGLYGDNVESGIVAALKAYAQDPKYGLFRLVSLRHEFPDAWYQLLNPPSGQAQKTNFTLEGRHFPAWLSGLSLQTKQVGVWPRPAPGKTINTQTLSLKLANLNVGNWSDGRGIAMVTGSPIRSWPLDGTGLDKTTLDDLLLLIKYSVL